MKQQSERFKKQLKLFKDTVFVCQDAAHEYDELKALLSELEGVKSDE